MSTRTKLSSKHKTKAMSNEKEYPTNGFAMKCIQVLQSHNLPTNFSSRQAFLVGYETAKKELAQENKMLLEALKDVIHICNCTTDGNTGFSVSEMNDTVINNAKQAIANATKNGSHAQH